MTAAVQAGAELAATGVHDSSGTADLTATGTVGDGHGYVRGGSAAPLVGAGTIDGNRIQELLPVGPNTQVGIAEVQTQGGAGVG